ncbi:multidrug efflux ABC transporter permease LieB [soil metagenome]
MSALVPLTERVFRSTLRDFDLLTAVLAPVGAFVGFTFVLQRVIDTGSLSYAQYVLPAIVVQSMLFGALTTADRAARDASSGFARRLRTHPIPGLIPLMARMLYCLIRSVVVIAAALAIAYPFGFRMNGGLLFSLAFIAIALLLALAMSLGADAVGSWMKRVDASSQLLMIPMLGLVLLSTGMAPASAFPDWVQPFVLFQPVSVVTETMRGLTDGNLVGSNVAASLAWCIGLLAVFGAAAIRLQRQSE